MDVVEMRLVVVGRQHHLEDARIDRFANQRAQYLRSLARRVGSDLVFAARLVADVTVVVVLHHEPRAVLLMDLLDVDGQSSRMTIGDLAGTPLLRRRTPRRRTSPRRRCRAHAEGCRSRTTRARVGNRTPPRGLLARSASGRAVWYATPLTGPERRMGASTPGAGPPASRKGTPRFVSSALQARAPSAAYRNAGNCSTPAGNVARFSPRDGRASQEVRGQKRHEAGSRQDTACHAPKIAGEPCRSSMFDVLARGVQNQAEP